mmetsp:Transcript_93512/g.270156  ORF Transcript_93512/g.270156 Transcript_93512/m.270156 type:complete len:195 (+) Transcript_93512:3-587(+)
MCLAQAPRPSRKRKPSNPHEEMTVNALAKATADAVPAAPTGAPTSEGRPVFAGVWELAQLEGDFEQWLVDMQQPYYLRVAAKVLRYGMGRVVVRCKQAGDSFDFAKTLTDPRHFRDAVVHFNVGDSGIDFVDDIGAVKAKQSRWDGDALVFDAIAVDTKLGVQLRMYFDDQGYFVEEMVSCTGRSIKYKFTLRK